MLTLRDVAEQAGVSVSTVSLVLNGRDKGRVRPEVGARVRDLAERLGYLPDLQARGFRTRRTHTIGLLSDQVASVPFSGEMLGGAQHVAGEEGYLLLLIDTDGDRRLERDAVDSLVQRNVDGLIYASAYHRLVDLPVVPPRIPLAVLDGRPSDDAVRADSVVPDERGGARDAVSALVRAGHRRIAFCTVSDDIPATRERRAGYEDALRAGGIDIDDALTGVASDSTTEAARPVAWSLLDAADPPTAVFCFGDQLAFGFYQVAAHLGLSIPEDLSIVGFDNQHYVADALDPGLTTVQLPHRAMGERIAGAVIDRLRTPRAEWGPHGTELIPCRLVERQSVAPPRSSRSARRLRAV
ncbi:MULTISPECIES: LacI family DNA-binding transcriptional regulator [unclassified Rathayibacter]|uniref:LacI family DNA-binding transcriptional regulator n=1 Tax=unclassified Rathayibacter TaxID=2609250 RepID=UPI0009E88AB5|nr:MULTISPECIES: LacI family DNA-binding transcriptional regulator [unclassified Rathayibacter]